MASRLKYSVAFIRQHGSLCPSHGTGSGGWCWRFIAPLLRAAGYDVYTPTLTELGASSHLLHELDRISLDTHVKDATNMLFYEDLSEVVLVGHSYGGMVITGVAAISNICRCHHKPNPQT